MSGTVLYLVTDRKRLQGETLVASIQRNLDRGVRYVQIREKDLPDRDLFELTREIVASTRGRGRILLNGRADLALAAGAAGVHLPAEGLRVQDIRAWVHRDFEVGVSAHSLSECLAAEEQEADYVILGPVFPTPSKASWGPPLGLDYLKRACAQLRIPVFAIGGMDWGQQERIRQAGAYGMAGIRMFQG